MLILRRTKPWDLRNSWSRSWNIGAEIQSGTKCATVHLDMIKTLCRDWPTKQCFLQPSLTLLLRDQCCQTNGTTLVKWSSCSTNFKLTHLQLWNINFHILVRIATQLHYLKDKLEFLHPVTFPHGNISHPEQEHSLERYHPCIRSSPCEPMQEHRHGWGRWNTGAVLPLEVYEPREWEIS